MDRWKHGALKQSVGVSEWSCCGGDAQSRPCPCGRLAVPHELSPLTGHQGLGEVCYVHYVLGISFLHTLGHPHEPESAVREGAGVSMLRFPIRPIGHPSSSDLECNPDHQQLICHCPHQPQLLSEVVILNSTISAVVSLLSLDLQSINEST